MSWDTVEVDVLDEDVLAEETDSLFSGMGGVVFTVVAFVLLIVVFLLGQRLGKNNVDTSE